MPEQHRVVAERVRALCEGGLEKYRAGDVEGALIDWDSARSMDSDDPTPQSYIQRVAMGLEPEEPEDLGNEADDLYAEVEVTAPTPAMRAGGPPDAEREFLRAAHDLFALDDLDAGWTLESEAAELPPPPGLSRAPSRGVPGLDEPPDVTEGVMGLPDGAIERAPESAPDVDELPALEARPGGAEPPADADDPMLELEPLGMPLAASHDAVGAGHGEFGGETADLEPTASTASVLEEYREASTLELMQPVLPETMSPPPEQSEEPIELPDPPAHRRQETDGEITIPGGVADDVAEPAALTLSDDALDALRPPEQGVSSPEDTTVERPGMVARGFALPDLDELDETGARTDDRYESTAEVQIRFRESTDSGLDDELTAERGAAFGEGRPGTYDEEMTVERRGSRRAATPGISGTYDEEMTVERTSSRRAAGADAPLDPPIDPPIDPSVIVDLAGAAGSSGSWEDLCSALSRQVDDTLPSPADDDDRVRLRVGAFIDRARLELDRGKTDVAAIALELALGEQPDSAVAQKLIHRHKDLLTEIYQMYLGDMDSIPTLAVPMHQLSEKSLDSRAVFLLSRIDGTFTFEEILDMSGMSHIEAYRHLAKLLLAGILEVR